MKDLIGKTFVRHGRTFTIVDVSPNRPRYPLCLRREDGKEFKAGVEQVAAFLNPGSVPEADPKTAIGKSVRVRGRLYTGTGFDPRRPRFPFRARRDPDGEEYWLDRDTVARAT